MSCESAVDRRTLIGNPRFGSSDKSTGKFIRSYARDFWNHQRGCVTLYRGMNRLLSGEELIITYSTLLDRAGYVSNASLEEFVNL